MKLNIIEHMINSNQNVCPLISLEIEIGMLSHYEIRKLPAHYERLSCKKILLFVGDNPDLLIKCPVDKFNKKLNVLIYDLIDYGFSLKSIGDYLNSATHAVSDAT